MSSHHVDQLGGALQVAGLVDELGRSQAATVSVVRALVEENLLTLADLLSFKDALDFGDHRMSATLRVLRRVAQQQAEPHQDKEPGVCRHCSCPACVQHRRAHQEKERRVRPTRPKLSFGNVHAELLHAVLAFLPGLLPCTSRTADHFASIWACAHARGPF